jgi:hypothetical protein
MPTIDPYAAEIVARRAPYDFVGDRTAPCSRCHDDTLQEGFKTFSSPYVGFSLPFARRPSTAGKIGKTVILWACTRCESVVSVN